MKYLVYILLIFYSATLDAQSDSLKNEWGFSVYNERCDRLLSVDNTYEAIGEELDSLERPAYGFSAGLVYSRKLNANWTISTGLQYASRGWRIDTIQSSNSVNFRSRFQLIEIPVLISKEFGGGEKVRPFVQTGVLLGYMIAQRNSWKQAGGTAVYDSSNLEELQRLQVSGVVAAGIEISVYDNWKISLDARFRQAIQPISDTPWKRYLNGAGVGILLKKEF